MHSWEVTKAGRTDYVVFEDGGVCIGSHWGSGMTDNAGVCSYAALLEGAHSGHIRERFGEAVLQEILTAAEPRRGWSASD